MSQLSEILKQARQHQVYTLRRIHSPDDMMQMLAQGYVVQASPVHQHPYPEVLPRNIAGYDPETDRVLATTRWGNEFHWMPRSDFEKMHTVVQLPMEPKGE